MSASTVMFTDMVGSTDLAARHGDEVAHRVMDELYKLVREQLGRHAGIEVKSYGDGQLLMFGAAASAVRCALDIQRDLEARNQAKPHDVVALRVGLHTGDVTLRGSDLVGAAVNAAARIMAKAGPGEVLVSADVVAACEGEPDLDFHDRGLYWLRGFTQRWRIYEAPWSDAPAPTRIVVTEGRTPFVGREDSRAQLRRLVDEAFEGRGGFLLLGGEAGVGKTRLVHQVAMETSRRGARVKVGHCYATAGTQPYIPMVEILEQEMANADSPERFIEGLGANAAEMARVLPRLRQLKPDLPSPAQMPADQERRYVHTILRDHLLHSTASEPQLVILEDIHWADEATILLIQHIAAGSAGSPLALVATYRDAKSELPPHVEHVVADLLRSRLAQRLTLKPMDTVEVAAMLRGLSGQDAPEELVRAIAAETDGNPFFVEEVFRNLADEGRLLDADGRFRRDLAIDDLDVPEGVRMVLSRRLERLGDDARGVLSTAALMGRNFDFSLVRAASDMDEERLISALEEAEWAELVTPRRNEGRLSYTFAHELIRQTLVTSVSAARRQRLHLRVAQAVESTHGDRLDDRAAELAHHYFEAGDLAPRGKAARFLKVAGIQATQASAYEEAVRRFRRAVDLLAGDDLATAENDYHLGLALRSVGRWDEALVRWGSALEIYERLGAEEATGSTCRAIAQHLAWAARWADSLEFSNRGLAALGDRVSGDRCQLMGMVGTTYSLAGIRAEAAEAQIAGARAIADELDDHNLQGYVDYLATAHHYCWLRLDEAIATGTRGADLLRASGDLWNLASTLTFVQLSAVTKGDLDLVAATDAELLALAHKVGHIGALMFSNRNRRILEFCREPSLAAWQESVDADQETCSNIKGGIFVPDTNTFDGLGRFWAGDWEAARRLLELGAEGEPPGSLGGNWAFVALALAYDGDGAGALEILESRKAALPAAEGITSRSAFTAGLVAIETYCVAGAPEAAAALYPAALGAAALGAVLRPFDSRLVQTLAGLAATAAGEHDAAAGHFAEATRLAASMPVGMEAFETQRLWAEALLMRGKAGDVSRARQMLLEAAAGYERVGMVRHVELARTRAGELTRA